jgi:hypothetical protein
LPSYSPELSRIEPLWKDVKHREIPERSFTKIHELKQAVDGALGRKAHQLKQVHQQNAQSLPLAA